MSISLQTELSEQTKLNYRIKEHHSHQLCKILLKKLPLQTLKTKNFPHYKDQELSEWLDSTIKASERELIIAVLLGHNPFLRQLQPT